MDPLKQRLERLGQAVARASDDAADTQRTLAVARQRLRQRAQPRSGGRSLRTLALGIAVVSAASFGAYALWSEQQNAPLTFSVEARQESTARSVQTGELETKQLVFSDGTTLSLQPASRLEVRSLTAQGATVGLSSGRARASVERSKDAEWRFLAGPFSVKVTGTEFDLAWDPATRVFELALHEGSVELVGPSVRAARQVRQGEFVRIAVSADDSAGPGASPAATNGTLGAGSAQTAQGAVEGPSTETKPTSAGAAPAPDARWAELLRSGQRKAAFAALDRLGPAALETADGGDLLALAHAARLGGRPQLAQQALLTLRTRHGARGQTAFLLGKVAADQLKSTPEAIKWFQTYLAEDPRGPLAEQALGRLIELQAGTRAGKTAAKEYLLRYPEGAYASFARSLLR